jgi:hypothetical protein
MMFELRSVRGRRIRSPGGASPLAPQYCEGGARAGRLAVYRYRPRGGKPACKAKTPDRQSSFSATAELGAGTRVELIGGRYIDLPTRCALVRRLKGAITC